MTNTKPYSKLLSLLAALLMAIGLSLTPASPVAAVQNVGTAGCSVNWNLPNMYGFQHASVKCSRPYYRIRVQCRFATQSQFIYGVGPWVFTGSWSGANCKTIAQIQGYSQPEKWVVNMVDVQIP